MIKALNNPNFADSLRPWPGSNNRVFLCFLAAWATLVPANGAEPTPGNFIVTVNEFTGSSTAPTYIAEYTISGIRVQTLDSVPIPGGAPGRTTEQARDLVLGPDNAIYVYNGTFTPYLARFDLGGSGWTQQTFDGWSTVNNASYGGVSRMGQYLFATDMATASAGTPKGIVRFDTRGGPTVRFPLAISPLDLTIGSDGVLYALDGAGSPRTLVYKYDASTFASLGSNTVAFADHRGVAVGPDGSIFLADWSGVIRRYSAAGTLLDSMTVTNANFSDIDINSEGRIILGTGFDGEVIVTDLTLDTFTKFLVTENQNSGDIFVAWVPAPPPQAAAFDIALSGNTVNLQISGTVGGTYAIQQSTSLASSNWLVLTNLVLTSSPYAISDSASGNHKFYRAVTIP